MRIPDVMSRNPAYCTPDDTLETAAKLMMQNDCGSLPVVENPETMKPLLGIVTDRDIVCRTLGVGKDPTEAVVKDVMSSPALTVSCGDDLDAAVQVMEENRIRRVLVVDNSGACCGVITQAHLAQHLPIDRAGEMLRAVSEKAPQESIH